MQTALRFLSFSVRPVLVLLLMWCGTATTQTFDEYSTRQLHEFRQCAGSCQITLDYKMEQCPVFVDEADNPKAEECRTQVRKQYESCIQFCPYNPRPDTQ